MNQEIDEKKYRQNKSEANEHHRCMGKEIKTNTDYNQKFIEKTFLNAA